MGKTELGKVHELDVTATKMLCIETENVGVRVKHEEVETEKKPLYSMCPSVKGCVQSFMGHPSPYRLLLENKLS